VKDLQAQLELGLLVFGFGTLTLMLLFCLLIGGYGEPAVRRSFVAWCASAVLAGIGYLAGFSPLYALAGMVSTVGVVMTGFAATGELIRRGTKDQADDENETR
jgi:hypothetical protein